MQFLRGVPATHGRHRGGALIQITSRPGDGAARHGTARGARGHSALRLHCRVTDTNTTLTALPTVTTPPINTPRWSDVPLLYTTASESQLEGPSFLPFYCAAGRCAVGYRRFSLRTRSSRAPPSRAAWPMRARDVTEPRGGGDERGLLAASLSPVPLCLSVRAAGRRSKTTTGTRCLAVGSFLSSLVSLRSFFLFDRRSLPPVRFGWGRLVRVGSARLSVRFGSELYAPTLLFHRVPLLPLFVYIVPPANPTRPRPRPPTPRGREPRRPGAMPSRDLPRV